MESKSYTNYVCSIKHQLINIISHIKSKTCHSLYTELFLIQYLEAPYKYNNNLSFHHFHSHLLILNINVYRLNLKIFRLKLYVFRFNLNIFIINIFFNYFFIGF